MDGGNHVKLFEGQEVYTGIAVAHVSAEDAKRILDRDD